MFFGSRKNPKGPKLSASEEVSVDLSGSRLRFLKPPSNTKSLTVDGKSTKKYFDLNLEYNIYDKAIYLGSTNNKLSLSLATRELYSYSGIPFFDLHIGGMEFVAYINYALNAQDLLNPAHYLNWIHQDVSDDYAPASAEKFWNNQFPLFWQNVALSGSQWICYAVQDMQCKHGDNITYFLRTAITPEHDIVFSFKTLTDDYDSGAFELFKNVTRFITDSIELSHSDTTKNKLKNLPQSAYQIFSQAPPISRFDDHPKNSFVNYKITENPNLFFSKKINRYLFEV